MTELDRFYNWYKNIEPNQLIELANNEQDEDKRNLLFDLVNTKMQTKQAKIIQGKFVM